MRVVAGIILVMRRLMLLAITRMNSPFFRLI